MKINMDLLLRSVTFIILLPLLIWLLTLGSWVVLALAVIVGVTALIEWFRIVIKSESLTQSVGFLLVGNAYIFLGCFIFWFLYLKMGWQAMLFVIGTAIVSDTSAFIVGNILRGPKLAPSISPNKTWSGAIGGVLGTVLLGYIFGSDTIQSFAFMPNIPWQIVLICFSIVSQLGDLLESYAKRKLNVKDSSHLIPGHGGILDRIDSILAVTYFAGLLALINTY